MCKNRAAHLWSYLLRILLNPMMFHSSSSHRLPHLQQDRGDLVLSATSTAPAVTKFEFEKLTKKTPGLSTGLPKHHKSRKPRLDSASASSLEASLKPSLDSASNMMWVVPMASMANSGLGCPGFSTWISP